MKSVPLHFSAYTYHIGMYSVHIHTILPVYLLLKGVVQDLRGIVCAMESITQDYFVIIFPSKHVS